MTYEEKLTLLTGEDFFSLFSSLGAEPRWTISGHQSIQILGFCHWRGADAAHSAIFDPETFKVTCFSECGGGMHLHTWIKRALELNTAQEAKDFLEDWIDDHNIDLSDRISRSIDFEYKERKYRYERLEPLRGISQDELRELYFKFDADPNTLNRLCWCHGDGISAATLSLFEVAYYPARDTIILPHHNVRGDIVGIYERSYKPLRKDVKRMYPDIPYSQLVSYPRSKYVPLLRDTPSDDGRTSYSFPNSKNLYGLHLAAAKIKETGAAIIYEGAKSCMLSNQWGFENTVATHTFGANPNHISMLIEQGADTFYLAFDKQFTEFSGKEWELYEHKTRDFAEQISNEPRVRAVYRILDRNGLLEYKDAPVDRGRDKFEILLQSAERLYDRSSDNEIIKKFSNSKMGNNSKPSRQKVRMLTDEEKERRKKIREESAEIMKGAWVSFI